jgi:hypothetical protein
MRLNLAGTRTRKRDLLNQKENSQETKKGQLLA